MGVLSYFLTGSSLVREEAEPQAESTRYFLDLAAQDQELADKSGFAPAAAAIDRAVAERQAAVPASEDRRLGEPDRRTGEPETRPEGAPERRMGSTDRRTASKTFGKRHG